MASTDGRAKIAALVDKLREIEEDYQSKRDAIQDEIIAIATGGETIADKLRAIRAHVTRTWGESYPAGMVYSDLENVPHLKRLMTKAPKFSKEEIMQRWDRYLASKDPYYVQRRHPFSLFIRDINTFVEALPLVHETSEAVTRAKEMRG